MLLKANCPSKVIGSYFFVFEDYIIKCNLDIKIVWCGGAHKFPDRLIKLYLSKSQPTDANKLFRIGLQKLQWQWHFFCTGEIGHIVPEINENILYHFMAWFSQASRQASSSFAGNLKPVLKGTRQLFEVSLIRCLNKRYVFQNIRQIFSCSLKFSACRPWYLSSAGLSIPCGSFNNLNDNSAVLSVLRAHICTEGAALLSAVSYK